MEVASRLVGLQTLPALLQDPVLAAMPGPIFGFLIDTLQHWGKVLEEAGLLVAMVAGLAVLGGAAARLAGWRSDARAGLLAGAVAWLVVMVGVLPAATPAPDFYQVSKNFQDPVVSANGWALQVGGHVGRPLRLSLPELEAIPGVTEVVTLECISNNVGGSLMSTGRFTGLPLRDLLTMAGPTPGARVVAFKARDGYTESLTLDTVMATAEILVAYRLNGAP